MKIGLVRRGHSATGGAEAYLIRFAREALRAGHTPVLITTAEWPEERWIGTPILRLDASSPEAFAAAFQKLESGCDVHLSFERVPGCDVFRAGDGIHAGWLKRREAFEPWWRIAFRWVNAKHGQLLRLEREIFDPANTRAVIANSRMVRDEIVNHFHYPAGQIHVIPNGLTPVEVTADRAGARRALEIPDDRLSVLFLGSGWERKGLAVAIKAVEMCEETTLLVAGRGPADLFRSPSAKFLGPVSDLSSLFAAADIFLLPTWYDPFSNACLEALAAGLPVITTNANGFAEVIDRGVHGEIVEPGDSLTIAEHLDAWRLNGRCASAAPACRERASHYSIEKNVAETLRVLESVAGTL